MLRGRWYRVDSPVPGASRAIVCTPCELSARSRGADNSRLAPMPVSRSSGDPVPRTEVRSRTPSTSTYRMRGSPSGDVLSGERADTGDVLPDDERLDGLGALVGVDGLDVGHVPHDVEVQQDAVAAEQVPCLPAH